MTDYAKLIGQIMERMDCQTFPVEALQEQRIRFLLNYIRRSFPLSHQQCTEIEFDTIQKEGKFVKCLRVYAWKKTSRRDKPFIREIDEKNGIMYANFMFDYDLFVADKIKLNDPNYVKLNDAWLAA